LGNFGVKEDINNFLEDREILEKLRNAETRNFGFSLLVRKFQQRVYWHIRKMVIDHDDTDDLVQEVFIKAWRHIDSFREESGLFTWIYKIATNESLNFLRKKRRRFFIPVIDIQDALAGAMDSMAHISGDDIRIRLQKMLLKLPDKQRLVFNMKYFDDLTYEEISEITDTSVGSLKASYHLAVKKLEEYLGND
jgi:RNA polymerase sigma-70 factor (ECF subfamily)